MIGNKTEHHVRTFFINYRKRYNLDSVLQEYEKEHGPIQEDKMEDDKLETIDISNDNSDVICLSPSPPKKELKTNNTNNKIINNSNNTTTNSSK